MAGARDSGIDTGNSCSPLVPSQKQRQKMQKQKLEHELAVANQSILQLNQRLEAYATFAESVSGPIVYRLAILETKIDSLSLQGASTLVVASPESISQAKDQSVSTPPTAAPNSASEAPLDVGCSPVSGSVDGEDEAQCARELFSSPPTLPEVGEVSEVSDSSPSDSDAVELAPAAVAETLAEAATPTATEFFEIASDVGTILPADWEGAQEPVSAPSTPRFALFRSESAEPVGEESALVETPGPLLPGPSSAILRTGALFVGAFSSPRDVAQSSTLDEPVAVADDPAAGGLSDADASSPSLSEPRVESGAGAEKVIDTMAEPSTQADISVAIGIFLDLDPSCTISNIYVDGVYVPHPQDEYHADFISCTHYLGSEQDSSGYYRHCSECAQVLQYDTFFSCEECGYFNCQFCYQRTHWSERTKIENH